MHYSAAPCEPAKTSAGCRATHQYVFTLTVHTNTSNSAEIQRLTSAPSMTINYPVVIIQRDAQHPRARKGRCNASASRTHATQISTLNFYTSTEHDQAGTSQ